jgi:hypothetical protein
MKNVKLFEEFIGEAASDWHATTPADLKKMAKGFKQDYYDREEDNLEPEDIDADFKFITDYLGTDQIVELIGGDSWGDHPDAKELTDRYYELVNSIKNKKEDELESGTDIITGTLNGAKIVSQYDGWGTPPNRSIMVSIKDIKKFNVGTDPFIKW